jgi:hypothetical protein
MINPELTTRYRQRFGFEPDGLGLTDEQVETAIGIGVPLDGNFMDILNRYAQTFGGKPHILWMDSAEAITAMQVAIDSGEPIVDPDIPEGAVI